MNTAYNSTTTSNRPDYLPAPATTSKETTKEEPATTEEEQPTSKTVTAPTPETTPAMYVTTANTDQQEDDPEEVVFLKGAELDKVIAEYSERNGLDIEYQKKQYYFYATPDGYIVKLDKSKPKKDLYIADEGPFYESYSKGKVTDRDIFFVKNMKTLSEYARQRLESPVLCHVRRTMTGDLSIDPLSRVEYAYNYSKCGYEAIPAKHPTPRESAVYVAAWNAYEVEQRARLEKYWKRYGHKVWVNTYYADR